APRRDAHAAALRGGARRGVGSAGDARVEGAPGPRRRVTQLFLDAQELVVLGGTLAARHRAGLDLARVDGDGEVRDEGVLGLAGAVRDDRAVARALRQLDRLERLGQRADLVQLHEHRVGETVLDPLLDDRGVRDEQVVPDELDALAERARDRARARHL